MCQFDSIRGGVSLKSIRSKIMVILSGMVAGFLLLLTVASSFMTYNNALSQLKQNLTSTVQITSDRIEQELEVYISAAEAFGVRSDISDPEVSVAQKEKLMNQWAERHGMIRTNLIDANGDSLFDGNNYSDREYFQKCMSGETYVSTPVISKVTNKLTVIVAAPLWDKGDTSLNPVGVVYFVPNEDFLNSVMASIQVSENSVAYMIDKDGTTIADINTENVAVENIEQKAQSDSNYSSLAAIHSKMRNGETGVGNYTLNGQSKIIAYTPLQGTDSWSVAISAPISDFMDATYVTIIAACVILVLSVVITFFIAAFVAGKIANPIKECANRLELLAAGDLTTTVPDVDSKDETGILAKATEEIVSSMNNLIQDENRVLGAMSHGDFDVHCHRELYKGDFEAMYKSIHNINHRLSDTLLEISTAADQVSSGSNQVAAGAQALSQGATQQASSVQELAAAMDEISRDIRQNAQSAENANAAAQDAGHMLNESEQKMNELVHAMEQISTSSSEIGRIIKTIEDIAFQTNILALNAAVEAARAGAAGKGFAVVADEVRNLAAKSAEASKSTSTLIEHSMTAVDNGTKILGEAAQSIRDTAERTKSAVSLMENISKASVAQADSITQVNGEIEQISNVVQTNSATAEQSAAASEELSGQAEMLKKLVGSFRLREIPMEDRHAAADAVADTSHFETNTVDSFQDTSKY